MLAGSLALLAYGVYLMLTSSFGIVAMVFGALGLLVRYQGHPRVSSSPGGQTGVVVQPYDENAGRLHRDGNGVFRREFSLSATVTRWLWATVVGTAGIVIWTRYYRKKFNRRRTETAVSDLGTVSPR